MAAPQKILIVFAVVAAVLVVAHAEDRDERKEMMDNLGNPTGVRHLLSECGEMTDCEVMGSKRKLVALENSMTDRIWENSLLHRDDDDEENDEDDEEQSSAFSGLGIFGNVFDLLMNLIG